MALNYSTAQRLTSARNTLDYLLSILETEMAYQNTNGPRATYSLGGQSVSWDAWLAGMQKAIKDQQELIRVIAGSWSVKSTART